MINFASLFGSFSRGGSSVINDLLDRPDVTLQQLLDVESFPNQYKSGNNKIIEFLTYPKYQQLINYVTVQGPADDQKKGYKFPMVAADVLSIESSLALQYFLPDHLIELEVSYESTEEVEVEVDDDSPTEQNANDMQKSSSQTVDSNQLSSHQETPTKDSEQHNKSDSQIVSTDVPKEKKKKIIKEKRQIKKTRKQKMPALITQLLSYYQEPVNYTLAGYNCKVLNILFSKKPENFLKFIFNSDKNYIELLGKHIESKSVGDFVAKMLVWENTQFVKERIKLFDHLVDLMSTINESHVLSNLAGAIYDIIEKTSTYIKTKTNIENNQPIIKTYLDIFYRTSQVHKIITSAMSEQETKSAYNCLVLHAYLHHTEIQTFNSFKLEEVLESFIVKASEKLRNIGNRKVLGMGRMKIVEIFSFLIRKPRRTIEEDKSQSQASTQLLQELYIHSMIGKIPDFFSILIKAVEAFQNNNILHNEVFKIIESILAEPEENGSALQELLLNDQNILLKMILSEAEKDKKIRKQQKHTKRKGYIGHLINLCKVIDAISQNSLLNQKIKKSSEFQQVLNTMVAVDVTETNKSLAGYEMKKNLPRDVMFHKEDILSAYAGFLSQCPKPQYQPQEKQDLKDEIHETVHPARSQETPIQQDRLKEQQAQKQLQQEERDEEKFNEVAANSEEMNQENPKYWITHMDYDVEQLLKDID